MPEWRPDMTAWIRFKSRTERERDLEREIQSHLELEAEESGEYGARRAFGNVTLVKEDVRAVWGWPRMGQLVRDVRYAVRGLVRERSFTLTTVATLTVALTLATVVFAVFNAYVL